MKDRGSFRLLLICLFSCALLSAGCQKSSMDDVDDSGSEVVNLSQDGYANCYIVSKEGAYAFTPTRGNSGESVGEIASVEALWESHDNTEISSSSFKLISNLKYTDGKITFKTSKSFTEGNIVIAAKNSRGTILWSWHIWITGRMTKQIYNNDAGNVMPRNLGSLSGNPGETGSSGLLYQWGRKDPFLGNMPDKVASGPTTGTIDFVIQNPMVFVTADSSNHDWYYTGSRETDDIRWTDSSSNKSIYDPCPVGWRVPDGGNDGLWAKAAGSSVYFYDYPYDKENCGMNFSNKFSSAGKVWYPAAGFIDSVSALLSGVGSYGCYWTASAYGYAAYCLYFNESGSVVPADFNYRASAFSIRCVKE